MKEEEMLNCAGANVSLMMCHVTYDLEEKSLHLDCHWLSSTAAHHLLHSSFATGAAVIPLSQTILHITSIWPVSQHWLLTSFQLIC